VAFLELSLVLGMLIMAIRCALRFYLKKDIPDQSVHAWSAIFEMVQQNLQPLTTISALSVLRYVSPDLCFGQYETWLQHFNHRRSRARHYLVVSAFTMTRIFYFIFGISAFAVKTTNVGLHLTQARYWKNGPQPIFLMLAFVNQVMEMTDIDELLQDRLFLFIFGGSKCRLSHHDRALQRAYFAAVMRQICTVFEAERLKAVILMATFNHEDLQHLVLRDESLYSQMPSSERRSKFADVDYG